LYSTSSIGSHLAAMAEDHRQIEQGLRCNIVRIIDAARAAGTKIAFCTVVSNLEGVEPLKSVHLVPLGRREEMEFDLCYVVGKLDLQFAPPVGGGRWRDEVSSALAYLNRAMEIDATYADMRYRRGKCLALLGQYVEAKREFEAARDLDMATGRARSYINRALKQECGKRGVAVVDIVPPFEAAARHGIMGDDLFIDEVHPNARGHEIIARTIVQDLFSRHNGFSVR
ncbi:MAG TPA: tetratricopeptide repeat protein, partial [Planctomycetaceae bacterium]|nr:tetratricopeptide repeat protein [Planctomycetaceae bacterium]